VKNNLGPHELLIFFLSQVPPTRRFQLAMKYNLYSVAVDAVIATKDAEKIRSFSGQLVELLGAQQTMAFRDKLNDALSHIKKK